MLKKYTLLSIILIPLFFSCDEDPFLKIEKETTHKSIDFFHWHSKNEKELLEKRKAIVFLDEEGYYAVNMFKIDAYTDFLKESNFFSPEFIQKEKDYWLGDCLDLIFEMQKEVKKGNPSIFPCDLNKSSFSLIKKNNSTENIKEEQFKVDSISTDLAILKYADKYTLKLKKEEGRWKIRDWSKQ